ncbi:hypothetical protein NE237_020871 [Protea cynaroides]|uniref:Uncharacterized protein n=1 Tax=Protea cynaroides TaxID=273540 RepID=A0A9Q0K2Q6_9MAGN|nr:hypothetical protein NE237_020871 [Protea cynaroides]
MFSDTVRSSAPGAGAVGGGLGYGRGVGSVGNPFGGDPVDVSGAVSGKLVHSVTAILKSFGTAARTDSDLRSSGPAPNELSAGWKVHDQPHGVIKDRSDPRSVSQGVLGVSSVFPNSFRGSVLRAPNGDGGVPETVTATPVLPILWPSLGQVGDQQPAAVSAEASKNGGIPTKEGDPRLVRSIGDLGGLFGLPNLKPTCQVSMPVIDSGRFSDAPADIVGAIGNTTVHSNRLNVEKRSCAARKRQRQGWSWREEGKGKQRPVDHGPSTVRNSTATAAGVGESLVQQFPKYKGLGGDVSVGEDSDMGDDQEDQTDKDIDVRSRMSDPGLVVGDDQSNNVVSNEALTILDVPNAEMAIVPVLEVLATSSPQHHVGHEEGNLGKSPVMSTATISKSDGQVIVQYDIHRVDEAIACCDI